MNTITCIKKIMLGFWLSSAMALVHAGMPLWTFIPLTQTTLTLAANDTATVRYQVTNQSKKTYRLATNILAGVTQVTTTGNCPASFVLGYQQSCVLTLSIHGSALNANINGGPIVCNEGNPNQCYQPSAADCLHITKGSAQAYTVGGAVSGLSGTLVLQDNGADDLTMNSNGSFTFAKAITQGAPYHVTVLTQPVGQTCSVSNGSGTMGGANISNIAVNCTANTTTLSTSLSELALSVTGLTEYGVSGTPSSGLPRIISITNTGSSTALNLALNLPTWPTGTTSITTCGSSLAASSSCTITITPGATASSNGTNPCSNGTAPVSQAIQVSADNATTVSSNVLILGYGCIYEGGYVYAFDDTTANTASVGGKVVTTSDQAAPLPNGIVWSSNGRPGTGGGGANPMDTSSDALPGIDEASTSSTGSPTYATFASFFSSAYTNPNPFSSASFSQCNGALDGVCNTQNILVFYNQWITNNTQLNGGSAPFTASPGPTNTSYYAAGLCKQTINTYSDWYLPAICEMGATMVACFSSVPTLQNIQSSLIDSSGLSAPSGFYWSSTEDSSAQAQRAWFNIFTPGGSIQAIDMKFSELGVRCSRVF